MTFANDPSPLAGGAFERFPHLAARVSHGIQNYVERAIATHPFAGDDLDRHRHRDRVKQELHELSDTYEEFEAALFVLNEGVAL